MRFLKVLALFLTSSLCFAAQPDRIAGTIDASRMVVLAKSLHPKAQPQSDLGLVDPSLKLTYMTLLMSPSAAQQKALDQLLAQQQDRSSASYHKWLTPQQFAERFGLSQNDLNKITAWLNSEGFQILSVGGGRNSVSFSGNAAQVQKAFATELHRYNVQGEEHFANASPLMIPATLKGIVSSVMGVHSFLPRPASRKRSFTVQQGSHPNYYDANFIFPNFLAPGDIATIYDINPLYTASTPIDGTGQKLAIVGQTDIYLSDINDFRSGFGLSQITGCASNGNGVVTSCNSTNFQYVLVAGSTDPGTTYACGDVGEADLDIEWSGAVARNAQIVFVNSPVTWTANCTSGTGGGVNASLNAVINPPSGPPLASVVSMSYGSCEAQSGDLESLLQQGNAEGVTIVNSSGDLGAATCDFSPQNSSPPFTPAIEGLAVSYPASSPEVTGVGGTALSLANDSYPSPSPFWGTNPDAHGGTAVSYIPELAWNDDEGLAQYCHAPASGDTFCSQGGPTPTPGWVPLTASATATQVQEDIWISISGGGASNCFTETSGGVCQAGFAQPSWQQTLSVPSAPAGVRYVPDVSFFASPNFPGYIFCTPLNPPSDSTSTCASGIFNAVDVNQSIVGGTSASSPVFAGIVALLNQYAIANGLQSTAGLGNINPTLYMIAANSSYAAFHPVTSGDSNVACQPNTPSIQPAALQCPAAGLMGYSASNFDGPTHYNLVTGLGSIDANALFTAWLASSNAPRFTLTTTADLSPTSVPAGQSASATVTIAPVNGSTQTITFGPSSCTGLPAQATCSFSPTSVTLDGNPADTMNVTVTVTTAANMAITSGATAITVKGAASGTGNFSQTTTINLTVTATNQAFVLTTTATTFPVTVGATATVNVAVANPSSGGGGPTPFVGASTALPLTYTCASTPALSTLEIACQVSPGNLQPTSAIGVTISLVTTAKTAQLAPLGRSRIFYAMLLPGLFGVVFAAGSRARGARLLGLIVVLGFSTLWMGACGGGSGNNNNTQPNPGTPAGSYNITINATTGGANPLTYAVPITLNVTQ
jgi:subtilase family serine protease